MDLAWNLGPTLNCSRTRWNHSNDMHFAPCCGPKFIPRWSFLIILLRCQSTSLVRVYTALPRDRYIMGNQVSSSCLDLLRTKATVLVVQEDIVTRSFPLCALHTDTCAHVLSFFSCRDLYHFAMVAPPRLRSAFTLEHTLREVQKGSSFRSWKFGYAIHMPSNHRLLRILFHEPTNGNDTKSRDICELCWQRRSTSYEVVWGLFICQPCRRNYWRSADSKFNGEGDASASSNPIDRRRHGLTPQYFVRWTGDTLSKYTPIHKSGRLVYYNDYGWNLMGDNYILIKPVFDPYTNEPCGPIVTQQAIDKMEASGQSIESFLECLKEVPHERLKAFSTILSKSEN